MEVHGCCVDYLEVFPFSARHISGRIKGDKSGRSHDTIRMQSSEKGSMRASEWVSACVCACGIIAWLITL